MRNEFEPCEGGCTCGHVRYQLVSEPMIVHGCHCRWCQRQNGSSFAVNALIEADRVEIITGDLIEIVVASPSGAGQKFARCPRCRIALWSYYLGMHGGIGEFVRFVRVGTLDEPDQFPPDIHIFTSTKQPWVILPSDTPAVHNYYNTEEEWSPASLKRRTVLLEMAGGRTP